MTDTSQQARAHPPETTEGWYVLHQILRWDRASARAIPADQRRMLRGHATEVLASLGREYDNERAALGWEIDGGDYEGALRVAGGLWIFGCMGGYYSEGRAWLREALRVPGGTPRSAECRRAA